MSSLDWFYILIVAAAALGALSGYLDDSRWQWLVVLLLTATAAIAAATAYGIYMHGALS